MPLAVALFILIFFFFQAEDGIRDYKVTGVQTCALPIYWVRREQVQRVELLHGRAPAKARQRGHRLELHDVLLEREPQEIGRASCREREQNPEEAGGEKEKNEVHDKYGLKMAHE